MYYNILNIKIEEKCDETAQNYRKIGNKHYQKNESFLALYNYNASIAYSKSKTEASLGYANRSAVYLERLLLKNCLQNIQLALDHDYPADNRSKLLEREEKCKKLMTQINEQNLNPLEIFKLSYPVNEKIPWLVDCVELRWTEEFGRGIYATKELNPGDVICVEEPVINYTEDNHLFVRCYYCAKGCAMNLIPCDQTASMMFCSTDCKEKLYSEAINKEEIVSADIKMLSSITTAFGSVQNFDNFIQDTDLKELKKTIFDFDWTNPKDADYKKNLMTCLLSLSANCHPFEDSCDIQKYVSEKAVQHLLSIIHMNQKTSSYIVNEGNNIGWNIGHHISLFVSLINHSCYSNVYTLNINDKVVTIVFKAIKAGDQLLVNYDELTSRADDFNVEEIYHFPCKCEIHEYMDNNELYFVPGSQNNETIQSLIRGAMIALKTNDHKLVKRSIQKILDEINIDTSIVKFVTYCYPMTNTSLRLIASYLVYPF